MRIKLELPNNLACLNPVLGMIVGVAQDMGFCEENSLQLQMATEEALTNVINYAFSSDEESTFTLDIISNNNGIELIIREKGIPFVMDDAPKYDPTKIQTVEDAAQQRGLGLYLMSNLVDHFEHKYLGAEGKETRLMKFIKDARVVEYEYPKNVYNVDENVEINIRKFEDSDALGVARCLYATYGYTYLISSLYNLDYLKECNAQQNYFMYTGTTAQGEVVVVCSATECEMKYKIMDIGSLAVSPQYRKHKLADKIMKSVVEAVRDRGMNGAIADCVTMHTASQKVMMRQEAYPCAVMVNLLPASTVYNNFDSGDNKYQTMICHYRDFRDKIVKLYLPNCYKEQLKTILNRINLGYIELPKQGVPIVPVSLITAVENPMCNNISIYLSEMGSDLSKQLNSIYKNSVVKNIATYYLYLPLNTEHIDYAVEIAKEQGYIFAGLYPGANDNDYLLMQKITKYDPHLDKVMIAEEQDRWMIELIKTEYNNNE